MASKQASVAITSLDQFDPRTAGKHDPGQLIILFDNRHIKPRAEDNRMSTYQSYYLDGLSRLGWPTYWEKPDLDPGNVKLVWYTVRPPYYRYLFCPDYRCVSMVLTNRTCSMRVTRAPASILSTRP